MAGLTIAWAWRCLGTGRTPCDEHGDGPKSDLASRKHMEATQHGVYVIGRAA